MVLIGVLAAALVATPLAGALARRIGLVDEPGLLKVQSAPVPYLGGLAIFVAVAVVIAAARPAFLLPMVLALALGMADDARGLSPRMRLAAEAVIGIVASTVVPGPLAGPIHAGAICLTVVVLINAFNLIDGLDGLATGVALGSVLGFAVVLSGDEALIARAMGAALVGFLVYNRPPARIYLGDGGSYLVGTTLALLVASSWAGGDALGTAIGTSLMVALPLADTAIAVLRRALVGRPLFSGDRGHVYDQLVARGYSIPTVSVGFACGQAGLSGVGIVCSRLSAAAASTIVVATWIVLGLIAVTARFLADDSVDPA